MHRFKDGISAGDHITQESRRFAGLPVASSCLEVAPGRVKVILHSRPGYVTKVPTNVASSTVLQAFHLLMCRQNEKLHLIEGPIRASEVYMRKTWKKN